MKKKNRKKQTKQQQQQNKQTNKKTLAVYFIVPVPDSNHGLLLW